MKIILCNPEVNLEYSHSRKGMYPPLGLLSIATHLELKYADDVEIKVIDGDVEKISPKMLANADIIGFHVNSFNYGNCIELSENAKEYGATIIFGGPHATVLWENIMQKRHFVDYIIINEGEIPFSLLIGKILGKNNLSFDQIPNLVYRDNGSNNIAVKSQKSYLNTAENMLIPSRKYIDIEKYIRNYRKVYSKSDIPFQRPLSIYSSKGCTWRDRTGGCIFCARLEKGVRFRSIPEIWKEIGELKKLYKTDYIWDISDDNLNNPTWFKKFVDQRPADCEDISFLIYSRVNGVTDDVIPYFKKLNVFEIYLGFESGDNSILKNMKKGATISMALRVAKKLMDAGIFYFPSFVIGLPGESEKSLKNTLKFAEELADIGSIFRMSATILMPIPGSKVFDMLLKDNKHGEEIAEMDMIPIKDLEKIWIERYTNVDYATAEEYQKLISEVITKSSHAKSFGTKVQ